MAPVSAVDGDSAPIGLPVGDGYRAAARAFEAVARQGPLSRADLRRRVGVGLSTITAAVQELVERDVVVEAGQAASTGGRPARLLDLAPSLGGVIAADIGGSNIRFAAANLRGTLAYRAMVPTPGPEESLPDVVLAGLQAARTHLAGPTRAIGVAVAGIVDPRNGGVSRVDNVPGWREGDDLGWLRALGSPLLIDNEANLGALGEHRALGLHGSDLLFVAVGAGIGGGLILGGHLYRGFTGAAGEIGLMHRTPSDDSELERVAAAHGLIQEYQRRGGRLEATPQEVVARAEAGEERAAAALEVVLDELATGIANAVIVLNPPNLVLGGGLVQSEAAVMAPLRERIGRLVPTPPRIMLGQLGAEAALVGAVEWAAQTAEREIIAELQRAGVARG